MTKVHVIVVGGGPAGASVAISCAQRGLNVLIIEEEVFPRYRAGETLHPGIEPLLKDLGVREKVNKANFLRHKGNWVKWEKQLNFIPFGSDENGPWLGYQAWRADFDSILLDHALSLGVEIWKSCKALNPIVQKERIIGLKTNKGDIYASFIIDATGRSQWLAKKLKLKIQTYSPRLIARYGYVEGDCYIRNEAPAIIADDNGWTWTACVRPGIYQWTRLSIDNEVLNKNWVPEEFKELNIRGRMYGADMTWRIITKPGGAGYFLVGDAAAILDPASSHGVLKAIMSGMMTGNLVYQILKKQQREDIAIQRYCKWINSWFMHDVEKLRKLYLRFANFEASS
ncbi:NAD(P)/FAD-dependent oxidoreductase [Priestia megaterium]|uniref:NAD(P)/FAD-dependent oxidoreductase n=1 Tax=Priestia megaterium TaxID=1404 RepID=UPI003100CA3A